MATQVLPIPAPPTTPAPDAKQKQVNLLEHALLLVLTRKWIPQTKTISNKVLTSNAESRMISVTKKLFDCPELKAIASNQVKVDEYLKRRSTPLPLKKSHHLLADDLFAEVESTLQVFLDRHNELVGKFISVYEKAVDEAKSLLGDQFNPSDYPSKENVEHYFYFGWEYLEFAVSERLKELNKEVAARKQEQFQAQIIQAADAANVLLTEQLQKLLEHIVDRLTPVEHEGELKHKVFRDKMLDPINDFLSVYEFRNLGNNEALTPLVNKVKALMGGVTVQQLKDNNDVRASLEKQIKEVKETVDKMIIDQPLRSISFEE